MSTLDYWLGWIAIGVLMGLGFIAGGGCMSVDLAGTWRVKDNRTVENLHGHWIADTGGKTHSQLIAAAPELLEALQELVHADCHSVRNSTVQINALKKATLAIERALGQ